MSLSIQQCETLSLVVQQRETYVFVIIEYNYSIQHASILMFSNVKHKCVLVKRFCPFLRDNVKYTSTIMFSNVKHICIEAYILYNNVKHIIIT